MPVVSFTDISSGAVPYNGCHLIIAVGHTASWCTCHCPCMYRPRNSQDGCQQLGRKSQKQSILSVPGNEVAGERGTELVSQRQSALFWKQVLPVERRGTPQSQVWHSANLSLGSLKGDFKNCCITGNLDDRAVLFGKLPK